MNPFCFALTSVCQTPEAPLPTASLLGSEKVGSFLGTDTLRYTEDSFLCVGDLCRGSSSKFPCYDCITLCFELGGKKGHVYWEYREFTVQDVLVSLFP